MMFFSVSSEPPKDKAKRLGLYLNEIKKKDKSALEMLYRETSAGVYSFALSLLKNREDAEDVLQEVYLSIYKNAGSYHHRGKPMEWIMTVTRNLCYSKLRSRRIQEPLSDDSAVDYGMMSDTDDRILLLQSLNTLEDDERRVVILHAVAGLRHREIATVLGIPTSTVSSRYNRALKKMRNILTQGGVQHE